MPPVRTDYHPGQAADWERRPPSALGLDAAALAAAEAYAVEHEVAWPRDMRGVVGRNDPAPYNVPLGPVRERGGPAGLVLRHGYIAHEWGDLDRADMTFSATKSYLATLVGLAAERGLIAGLDAPVAETCDEPGFQTPHNAAVTWRHLLQQTSEWEGTLFGIPDTVDHNRTFSEPGAAKGTRRRLGAPGTYWEYNDVRVNALGLATLHAWREPLPSVLRREVMDPIGASPAWHWHGYRNAWVDIDGRRICSVPGGAHWGGGMFVSTYDHARFGLLMLRGGVWDGARLLSQSWLKTVTAPCDLNPRYGAMWWLNTGQRAYPAAPESAFAAQGAGGNVVFVDPEHDLVVVTRWTTDPPGVVERVVGALA
ncbi:MAG: serine hydrolase [Dehalococcoidia bacterium]|nr:serine hydrolase [Dehalococcoidia bacterium]